MPDELSTTMAHWRIATRDPPFADVQKDELEKEEIGARKKDWGCGGGNWRREKNEVQCVGPGLTLRSKYRGDQLEVFWFFLGIRMNCG